MWWQEYVILQFWGKWSSQKRACWYKIMAEMTFASQKTGQQPAQGGLLDWAELLHPNLETKFAKKLGDAASQKGKMLLSWDIVC